MGNPARIFLRPFQSRRQRTTTALELSGEWLKLAQVEVGAKGKRLLRLIARPVAPQEELSQTLVDLFKTGMSSADSIVISIPRNLVTVRNLQLPTTDPNELKEMIDLQAAKQTPYAKEEIIADFQVVRRSPEGYTDVVLITTHRSVSNRCLKILDDFHLKAAGIRLSSHGVLSSWQLMRGATRDEERGPTAVLDIDSNFSDFLVTRSGAVTFTKALSIGSAKLAEEENETEKLAEEIQRAVDIYESERVGQGITKLVVTGAEVDLARLIPSFTAKLRLPVQRVSLVERLPGAREAMDLPEAQRGSVSFAAVLGLAWNAERAGSVLTPLEGLPEADLLRSQIDPGALCVPGQPKHRGEGYGSPLCLWNIHRLACSREPLDEGHSLNRKTKFCREARNQACEIDLRPGHHESRDSLADAFALVDIDRSLNLLRQLLDLVLLLRQLLGPDGERLRKRHRATPSHEEVRKVGIDIQHGGRPTLLIPRGAAHQLPADRK